MVNPAEYYELDTKGTEITISDYTDEYAVDTNDGGYGSPNLDRNDYAVVVYPRYKWAEKAKEEIGVSTFKYKTGVLGLDYNAAYTNTKRSMFEVPVVRDGVYEIPMILVPISVATEEGNIRYNTTTSVLEIYTEGSFVELTDFEKLLNPVLLPQTDCSEIILTRTRLAVQNFWELYIKYRGTGKNEENIYKGKHHFVNGQMISAFINHRQGSRLKAQEIVEGIDNMCNVL